MSSNCANVDGEDSSNTSCSEVFLVNVSYAKLSRISVKMYATLDDQSNKSRVFLSFSDPWGELSYNYRICPGISDTAGGQASGFLVEIIDNKV